MVVGGVRVVVGMPAIVGVEAKASGGAVGAVAGLARLLVQAATSRAPATSVTIPRRDAMCFSLGKRTNAYRGARVPTNVMHHVTYS
jgi:hypothetical protein